MGLHGAIPRPLELTRFFLTSLQMPAAEGTSGTLVTAHALLNCATIGAQLLCNQDLASYFLIPGWISKKWA